MKGLYVTLLSAATIAASLGVIKYSGIDWGDLGAGKPSLSIKYEMPQNLPFELSIDPAGRAEVNRAASRYAGQIESMKVMMDGQMHSPYASANHEDKVALFTVSVRLKNGSELRSSIRKCERKRLSRAIADTVDQCFEAYARNKKKGVRARVYSNL